MLEKRKTTDMQVSEEDCAQVLIRLINDYFCKKIKIVEVTNILGKSFYVNLQCIN